MSGSCDIAQHQLAASARARASALPAGAGFDDLIAGPLQDARLRVPQLRAVIDVDDERAAASCLTSPLAARIARVLSTVRSLFCRTACARLSERARSSAIASARSRSPPAPTAARCPSAGPPESAHRRRRGASGPERSSHGGCGARRSGRCGRRAASITQACAPVEQLLHEIARRRIVVDDEHAPCREGVQPFQQRSAAQAASGSRRPRPGPGPCARHPRS